MRRLYFLALLCAFINGVWAGKQSYLARFGEPKYKGSFTHFNYVNPDAPKGGRIRLSTTGTFDTLNKFSLKGLPAEGLILTFDALMVRSPDEPFTLYGLVAREVDVADDNSSVTFYLNPKAKFHDGTSITADDVKFSYEILRNKGGPSYRHHYSKIKSIDVLDAHTIKLRFHKTAEGTYDEELPMIVALMTVLPKNQLRDLDFTNTGLFIIDGSGPYKIGHVEQGRSITYQRVSDYWAKDLPIMKGQYNFDEIRIDYYKNAQVQFQGFLSGDTDMYFETNPNNWRDGYKVKQVETGQIKRVEHNHERPVAVKTILMNLRKPLFEDWRLRRALVLAFDAHTVNRVLFDNDMKIVGSLFANTILAHRGPAEGAERALLTSMKHDINPHMYEDMLSSAFSGGQSDGHGNQRKSLEEASDLLDEAGWKSGRGGVRRNDFDQPLSLNLIIKDPKLEKLALHYKESLKKIGITLIVKNVDAVQYENRIAEGDFDMLIHTWANSLSPGAEQVYYFGKVTADVKGSSNYMGIKDDVAQALSKKLAEARTYPELIAITRSLDRYIMHFNAQVPLFYDNSLRFAYWFERLAMPPIDPKVGMDIVKWGWEQEPVSVIQFSAPQESLTKRFSTWIKKLMGWA